MNPTEIATRAGWKVTGKTRDWLKRNGAPRLASHSGFVFYENPIFGDERPAFAVETGTDPDAIVWLTNSPEPPDAGELTS